MRRWTAATVVVGVCAVGSACRGGGEEPSAQEREARSEVLRGLFSSRERMPSPGQLEAQRRDLRAEVGTPESPEGQGGSGRELPTARVTGQVAWVGDDELLLRDSGGVEREVRVEDETRFVEEGQEVSRRTVEEGARIQVAYEVEQGEWVAREVALLSPPPLPSGEGRGEGPTSPFPLR
ncbi:MAG TPA: hypothetical protein VF815_28815 [Myxococcaceae bacterium]